MKGHNLDWKKKENSTTPHPPKKKEVEEIEPVIAEHASQCTFLQLHFVNIVHTSF